MPGAVVRRPGQPRVARGGRAGDWWLVAGGWWLVAGSHQPPITNHQSPSAVLVERLDEIFGDVLRRSSFDLPALEHVHELTVLEQTDRRRGRRIAGEVLACALRRFDVLAREHRG